MDSKALLVSLLGHGLLLSLLWYNFSEVIRPAGEGDYSFVAISLVNETEGARHLLGPSVQGVIQNTLNVGGHEGGEGGTSEILRQIRNKIERAKFYPLMAKRQNIEGAPLVEFQIQSDGSVQDIRLKQTSGSEILDEAALQTVRQAVPFPFYPNPISLSIRYALGDKPH